MEKIVLLFIILFGCDSSDNQTRNRSTSQKDISYYNLQYYSHIDNNGTQIDIAIPKELQKLDPSLLPENIIAQYEFLDPSSLAGSGLYSVDITKLESRNTIQFANEKEYLDIVEKAFYSEYDGSLEKIAQVFPPEFKEFKISQIDFDQKINGQLFHKQIRYYYDNRLKGSDFENSMVTSFHYYTLFNKRKYSFNISYFGNDKSAAQLIGKFNSIAESIIFKL